MERVFAASPHFVRYVRHLLIDLCYILYSRKFSLVQNFAKMPPDSSEEIFMVFIFAERMRDALTTPLLVDGHTPHANRRNDEAKKQACATTV